MKVVYRKTITEWIAQERVKALAEGREIEKIVLTVLEARQLLKELENPHLTATWLSLHRWLFLAERGYNPTEPQPPLQVLGINIEISR